MLVPYEVEEAQTEAKPAHGRFLCGRYRWGIALLAGILIGAGAFFGEMSEGRGGGALLVGRQVLVASVFVGLGLSGILIAYAFLGKPLGLLRR